MKNRALSLAVLAGICCVAQGYTKAYAVELSQMPVVGGQVSATTAAASGTVPVNDVQYSKSAMVRVLDKQTNRVDHLTLELGKTQKWGLLAVTLQRCAWGVGGVPVQDVAWLDASAASGEPEFHGWMFNTFPSVATYDHPRFDIALEKCVRPAGYTAPVPARVAPPQPSGQDREGADDEAPNGMGSTGVNSEFVVPGIPNGGGSATPPAETPTDETPPAAAPEQQPVPAEPAAMPEPEPPVLPQAPQQPEGDQQQLQRMMDMPAGQ